MGIFLLVILVYLVHIFIISTRSLHMLQQNRYNRGYRYIKWIIKNYRETLINFSLLFFVFIFGSAINDFGYIIFLAIVLFVTFVFIDRRRKDSVKLPLKYTARILRLIVTNMIIYIIPILIMLLFYEEKSSYICYLILGIMSYLNYFIVLLDNFINRPVEKMVNNYFRNKAIDKLNSMESMEVIGITGSYGKTSTKNILYDVLSVKYNIFKTPENYNTPYGLMISINNFLDKYNDYFIAEMGACKVGEIQELCDLVHPKYGILTKVGLAHLETFGSEENITKTKFELIESLPSDGIGILNGDDPKQVDHMIKNKCKILWIGIDNKKVDTYAYDIDLSYRGTKFRVKFKDLDNDYIFETKLLGKNNIYNILASITLGHVLGISIKDLQKAVKYIKPIEHRLSMKKMGDINIIDDAYNSNPDGSKMALEVLHMMPGKKIIVTPGMIEIGEKEDEVNKEFGREIAKTCDEVILIGENKTKPIYDGIIEEGFNKNNIHVLNDVMEAFPLINKLKGKETYVLLENDLPDSFNEKKGLDIK